MKTCKFKFGKNGKTYRIRPFKPRIKKLFKSIIKNPIKSLSLGIIILGIGCISFYVFGMMEQTGDIQEEFTAETAELSDKTKQIPDKTGELSEEPVYLVNPSEGDLIGTIAIPALNKEIDIFQGTGADELRKGVGHFTQSVLPGVQDNCVLSGHNDGVFTKLDTLEIGDLITVATVAGEFTYKVTGTRIVDKDDKTVIVPTEEAVLTLTTCYPFIVIGAAPERYIVSASLVEKDGLK